jgi:NDP-mannose synthase
MGLGSNAEGTSDPRVQGNPGTARVKARPRNRRSNNHSRAVILCGGFGTRLAPYTSVLPKPLMPIGDRAILEIVVDQLAEAAFREITFCVGYLSHLIRAVFGDRSDERVQISYVHESEPLGTAGPLRHVEGLDSSFLVMNGDVLTTLDYRRLLRSHRLAGSALTIATHTRTQKSDYGILHLDGTRGATRRVRAYEEKPELVSAVSMGVYVFEPHVLELIPPGTPFDFPDLVWALLGSGQKVAAYPHEGLWLDIGRPEDHARAVELWEAATPEAAPREAPPARGRGGGRVRSKRARSGAAMEVAS